MNATVEDLSATIIPKSDQLNADQIVTGPIDITVTEVRVGNSADQPVTVFYEGDGGRPFKPCKTMRRVLILAWGKDGRQWPGKSMRLYHAPEVRFGGSAVGGIRISHLTDIPRDITVSLSETKGKKAMHTIKRMDSPTVVDTSAIDEAADIEKLKAVFGAAFKAAKGQDAVRGRLKVAYDMRLVVLNGIKEIEEAGTVENARAALAAYHQEVPEESHHLLQAAFDQAWNDPPNEEGQG